MNIQISIPSIGVVSFSSRIPDDYKGMIVPGSRLYAATGEFGWMVIQEIEAARYSIRYHVYRFLTTIRLSTNSVIPGIYSRTVMKGKVTEHVKKKIKLKLRNGQFNLLYANGIDELTAYTKRREYEFFEAWVDPSMLEDMAELFPPLHALRSSTEATAGMQAIKKPRHASAEMFTIIEQILHCGFEPELARYYRETKLRELVFLQFAESYRSAQQGMVITDTDEQTVRQVQSWIETHMDEHFSAKELARKFRMNEFKLKTVFKRVVSMGTFEYLLHLRLTKARKLIEETELPMKEIAAMTGYSSIAHFVIGFRRKFGITPGSIRRK